MLAEVRADEPAATPWQRCVRLGVPLATAALIGALMYASATHGPGLATLVPLENVRLETAVRRGVRFAPASIEPRSVRCEPFAMDANASVRERMHQRILTAGVARAMPGAAAPPAPRARTRCSMRACDGAGTRHVLSAQDACWFNRTLYLLSDRDAPPALIHTRPIGPPAKSGSRARRRIRYSVAEVAGGAEAVPAAARVWLPGTWVLLTPEFKFGQRNMFHAILEDLAMLTHVLQCARAAPRGAETNYLLLESRKMLSNNTVGRLWELATDGGRSWYVPTAEGERTAFCFRRAHVDAWVSAADLPSGDVARAEAACERSRRADADSARGGGGGGSGGGGAEGGGAGAHSWEGWPAPEASRFRGLDDVVATARRRLRVPPRPDLVASARWAAPRVTVVHRLSNRRILNVDLLAEALAGEGMAVTVASLECLPLEAQLALVSNSSTLLGIHGAGLSLGHTLPADAAVLELRTAPCAEEARGVPYQMRRAARIVPAPREAVMPTRDCPPPWKYNSRERDGIADIAAVLDAIYELDPVASQAPQWAANRTRWLGGRGRGARGGGVARRALRGAGAPRRAAASASSGVHPGGHQPTRARRDAWRRADEGGDHEQLV